ncbi:MAG: phosphoribosylformylglycinamidine synthase II, partial [Epsilonproteobacteria bacterium]|nr:phosphoribosylformylglycinamidine synthase II [Campylobacterota bacterium]
RNVAMSGARPLAITDCLNFGNPENPEVMWQFAQSCEGIKEACKELNTPVVSGNVSLYNETNGISVYPTPAIAMVGLNDDANKVLKSSFTAVGNDLLLIGQTKGEFGGSLYIKELFGETSGSISDIDYSKELRLWELVIEANKKGLLESSKDLSMGGIAIALAKMSAVSGLGVEAVVELEKSNYLFDESQSRAVLEVKPENLDSVVKMALDLGLGVQKIGIVKNDDFKLNDINMSVSKIKDIYFTTFAKTIEQDL